MPERRARAAQTKPFEVAARAAARILCVSTSLKPAPGWTTPSASRILLEQAARTVATVYPDIELLDLRAARLPFFDGRLPSEMPQRRVGECVRMVEQASALFFGIPAYWRAVCGSFKNFVELLCGPAYDSRVATTPFHGKAVGYFVVGADAESARAAGRQARAILKSVGARVVGTPVVLGNPAELSAELPMIAQHIVATLGILAQAVSASEKASR